jgi:predicted NUDIX family phosphoesterase
MEGKAMAGYLQGVAGFLTYKEDPRDSNLLIEMHKELVEETGVKEEQVINLELLGLFSDPSVNGDDLDFGLLIHTNVPADYFSRGHWKNHVQKKEKDHNAQIIFSQTQHYLNVQILYHQ